MRPQTFGLKTKTKRLKANCAKKDFQHHNKNKIEEQGQRTIKLYLCIPRRNRLK